MQFKEADIIMKMEKNYFRTGIKCTCNELEFFLSTHDYMPVSRNDYNHAGEDSFQTSIKIIGTCQ